MITVILHLGSKVNMIVIKSVQEILNCPKDL